MTDTLITPFAGLKRKRLPGMHLITALEGGASLREALSGFFFGMEHDSYPHTCLIRQAQLELSTKVDEAIHKAGNPEGMFFANMFGGMSNVGLAYQEWSYLSEEEAASIEILVDAAIEQTQRWICAGVETPQMIGFGPLVTRPNWAIRYYNQPDGQHSARQESIDYVASLRQEIEGS